MRFADKHHFAFQMRRILLTAILFAIAGCGDSGSQPPANQQTASNLMRWEKHDAMLNNAVAWQQEDVDKHWVTFVLLTDRPVPAGLLADTSVLDPARLSREDQVAEKAGAQALVFQVMTGGIPVPAGKTTQRGFDVWYHDGDRLGKSMLSGAGGIDVETLTADRIKGRAIHGWATDKDDMWSVGFDIPIAHGNAARMAAEGEALGKDGGQPGKDLIAALDAMRKKDYAALKIYASPEMAATLNDAAKRDDTLEFIQRLAGDSQQIVNGLRNGDKASVYWVKKWKDTKVRNSRCTDSMVLLEGKWRSSLSSCATE
jgi:hypothetical protein